MNCLWPRVGIASTALQSGEGRAPAELCLPLWPGGQWRFMEIWDLRCSFSSISTYPFLLLRIKPGVGKSWWLANDWLLMSLSRDCPYAKCLFSSDCPGKTTELYKLSWSWRTRACWWVTRVFHHLPMISSTKCWFSAEQPAVSAAGTQGHPWLTTTGGFSTQ